MASEVQVAALIDRQIRLTAAIRAKVVAFVLAAWDGMTSHRDADVEQFIAAVVPVVTGGQTAVAAATDRYLSTLASLELDRPVTPVGIAREIATGARGVAPEVVYRRPATAVYSALSEGVPYDEAVRRGATRAEQLVVTDMQLAETHSARAVLTKQKKLGVVGYRRVLTGSESCAMCIVASTQRYRVGNLMPIHPACDCKVRTIYGKRDPGRALGGDILEQLHGSVSDRLGAASRDAKTVEDYRKILVTHEHGEIGPVLSIRGHNFTGPDDV